MTLQPSDRAMDAFAALCAVHARWFRYSVHGWHNVPARSSLLVGYHGRPAYDMFMLLALTRRRTGHPVWGITHRAAMAAPGLGRLLEAFALYDGSDEQTAQIVARGDHVAVLPGGTAECFRSSRTLYSLRWGRRRGYLKFALRHRLPIVPMASSGVDEFLHLVGEGYDNGMRVLGTDVLPLFLALGLGGLPYPLGLPRPVQVRQLIGAPIDLAADANADPDDEAWLASAHERVSGAVAALLDRAQEGGQAPVDGA